MSEITIELLNTRQSRQRINGYEVSMVAKRSGYQIVAGENGTTEIEVFYPTQYKDMIRFVHMQNTVREYGILEFAPGEERVTFSLPKTMTYAGNTWLTFVATDIDGRETNWTSIPVLITATHVDYKKVALSSPDILEEAIRAIEKIERLVGQPSLIEDRGKTEVTINGKLEFRNIVPYVGDNGKWWIGNVDIGVIASAVGIDKIEEEVEGLKHILTIYLQDGTSMTIVIADGETPYIGNNENWWFSETDTGVKARGGLTLEAQNAINANTQLSSQAMSIANSVRLDADNGVFKGEKGEVGANGIIINENVFLGFSQGASYIEGEYTVTPISVLGASGLNFSTSETTEDEYTVTTISIE